MADEGQELEVAVDDGGRVHMLDRAGAPVTIAEADVGKALGAGFQLESREAVDSRVERAQYETPLEQAKALGEGAVRGATLGLGTAALAELGGDEYREAANRRLRLFPGTAVVGEVGGALAPALLTGGAGTAARAAELAPVSVASRVGGAVERGAARLLGGLGEGEGASLAARAAREAIRMGSAGAAEGAAYGLGSSLADSALEGTDWTAERALTGAEHGAVYGLTGGAALGAGGEVLGAAGRKVLDAMVGEGKTLRQAVQDFADGRGVKTVVGNDVATFRKLTEGGTKPERIGEAAEWLRERKIPVGGPIEESRDALAAARKADGQRMGEVARAMDGTELDAVSARGLENAGYLKNGMREESYAKVRAEFDSGQPTRPVDVTQYPDGTLSLQDGRHRLAVAKERGLKELPAKVSVMDADGNIIRELTGPVSIAPRAGTTVNGQALLDKISSRLSKLEASKVAGNQALAASIRRQVKPLAEAVEKGESIPFSRLWEDSQFIGQKVREASRKASPSQVQMEALYDDFRGALREAVDRASPDLAARWRAAERDYAIASTLYQGAKTEATRQLKNRFVSPSDYGTGLASALASIATGGGAPAALLTGLATSVAHKFVRERGSAVIGKIADWAAKTELGVNHVADRLVGVAEHEGELAGPLLQRVKAAGKLTAKTGVEGRDVSQRTDERRELGEMVLRGALRTQGHEKQEPSTEHKFEAVRGGLITAQQNPQVLIDHVQRIIEPIAKEQPEVASAMARKLIEDHQYLTAQLPKPLSQFGRSLAPANQKPLFSRRDQKRLVSQAEALNHTEKKLAELASGKIDFDAVDALKARRPALWSSMQQRVAMRLAEPDANVPHRRRVLLSVLFDIPGDPSMAPGTLAAIGASLAPPPGPEAPPPKSKLDPQAVGRSMATPSQLASVGAAS